MWLSMYRSLSIILRYLHLKFGCPQNNIASATKIFVDVVFCMLSYANRWKTYQKIFFDLGPPLCGLNFLSPLILITLNVWGSDFIVSDRWSLHSTCFTLVPVVTAWVGGGLPHIKLSQFKHPESRSEYWTDDACSKHSLWCDYYIWISLFVNFISQRIWFPIMHICIYFCDFQFLLDPPLAVQKYPNTFVILEYFGIPTPILYKSIQILLWFIIFWFTHPWKISYTFFLYY